MAEDCVERALAALAAAATPLGGQLPAIARWITSRTN
jgi:hypothetical protein